MLNHHGKRSFGLLCGARIPVFNHSLLLCAQSELVTLSARCLLGLHMQTGIAIALTERLAPIVFDGTSLFLNKPRWLLFGLRSNFAVCQHCIDNWRAMCTHLCTGGGNEHYAAALGLLRYDATVASGVGLPHGSLPEPSAYTALLQV